VLRLETALSEQRTQGETSLRAGQEAQSRSDVVARTWARDV